MIKKIATIQAKLESAQYSLLSLIFILSIFLLVKSSEMELGGIISDLLLIAYVAKLNLNCFWKTRRINELAGHRDYPIKRRVKIQLDSEQIKLIQTNRNLIFQYWIVIVIIVAITAYIATINYFIAPTFFLINIYALDHSSLISKRELVNNMIKDQIIKKDFILGFSVRKRTLSADVI